MLVAFLTVIGLSLPNPGPNSLCVEILQNLREEHRMEVVTAQTVNNDTIVYLLIDKNRRATAQVGCRIPE